MRLVGVLASPYPDLFRWRRLLAACPPAYPGGMAWYGSMEDLAERFGYKNAASARRAHYRAKCMLRKHGLYSQPKSPSQLRHGPFSKACTMKNKSAVLAPSHKSRPANKRTDHNNVDVVQSIRSELSSLAASFDVPNRAFIGATANLDRRVTK